MKPLLIENWTTEGYTGCKPAKVKVEDLMTPVRRPRATALLLSLLAGLGLSALAGCATSGESRGFPVVGMGYRTPSDFRVVGYFPSWSGDPDQVQYRALTHINYAFVEPTMEGGYAPVPAPEKLVRLVTYAHAFGVKVLVSLGGWNDGGANAYDSIAADPLLVSAFCVSSLALLEGFELDGIDMDWEFPRSDTAVNFALLMRSLSEALHARHKLLTVAVTGTNFHGRDYLDSVVEDVDFMNIMAYDDGYGQFGVHHSTYLYAEESLDYWLVRRGIPASKAVLGLPFYGRNLFDRDARTFRSILAQDGMAGGSDLSGEYGYNGFATIRAKTLGLARAKGGGVMIWQLNQDARGRDSLLNAIFDAVKEDWKASG